MFTKMRAGECDEEKRGPAALSLDVTAEEEK
jgi:hypothetical protein